MRRAISNNFHATDIASNNVFLILSVFWAANELFISI